MGKNKPQCNAVNVYNEELIPTRAVLPITCKATETEAGMAANCVDTPSKLTALLLPCLAFIHIYKDDGHMKREGDN